MTTIRVSFCVNSLHFEFCECLNNFFLFFSDLSRSHRKKRLDLKIVFAVSSVVVFIAFCTVLWLYIKGNAEFNLITQSIMLPFKCCSVLKSYLAWNNTQGATLACSSFPFCFCMYLLQTQHINENSLFVTKVLTEVDVIDYYLF